MFHPAQIVRPLAAAGLLALALVLTFRFFHVPPPHPEGLARYLADGYCQFMIGVFLAGLFYAGLQGLGLRVEHRQLDQPPGQPLPGPWAWLAGVLGRPDPGVSLVPPATLQTRAETLELLLLARARQHQHNFAPLGFVIWVLPLLGFIGTVVGITQAIGGLERTVAPEAAAASLAGVLGGLRFAFDTTLIGLVLVIPTMILLLMLRARAHRLDMRHDRRLRARLGEVPDAATARG